MAAKLQMRGSSGGISEETRGLNKIWVNLDTTGVYVAANTAISCSRFEKISFVLVPISVLFVGTVS